LGFNYQITNLLNYQILPTPPPPTTTPKNKDLADSTPGLTFPTPDYFVVSVSISGKVWSFRSRAMTRCRRSPGPQIGPFLSGWGGITAIGARCAPPSPPGTPPHSTPLTPHVTPLHPRLVSWFTPLHPIVEGGVSSYRHRAVVSGFGLKAKG
jgi:hypothetical protein